MKDKHIGSSFDDFLQEEDLMALAEATALKRISAQILLILKGLQKSWELRTAERIKNPPPESQDFLFSRAADIWLVNCQKRYKEKTCSGKAYIINAAMEFWGYDPFMDDFSALMFEDFLNSISSGKTANRYKRELGSFLIIL